MEKSNTDREAVKIERELAQLDSYSGFWTQAQLKRYNLLRRQLHDRNSGASKTGKQSHRS